MNYVLIPSYEPTQKLVDLIIQLQKLRPEVKIIVVNDGSDKSYDTFFKAAQDLGVIYLQHEKNLGKGAALKTGISYLQEQDNVGSVVCADSDGQHKPQDIYLCLDKAIENPSHYVLGVREFTGHVPLRSRFGNTITRLVYLFASGTGLKDTQTGLRAFGFGLLPWLSQVEGERFEYEMNALLEAPREKIPFLQLPIETVYEINNHTSHFRTFRDSFRVYLPILKFSWVSLTSGLVDYFTFLFLIGMGLNLMPAVFISRMISGTLNFTLNRKYVFKHQSSIYRAALRYFSVALSVVILDYFLLYFISKILKIHVSIAKIIAEAILAILSFTLQRFFVFSVKKA